MGFFFLMFLLFILVGLGLVFSSNFISFILLSLVVISRGVGSRWLLVLWELILISLFLSIFLIWLYLRFIMKLKKFFVVGGMLGFFFRICCNLGLGGDFMNMFGGLGCDFRFCFFGICGFGIVSGFLLIVGLVVLFVILVLFILGGVFRFVFVDFIRFFLLFCGLK